MRAGASVDVVVAETGWPADKVLRYAEPVLGERDYVASQGRKAEQRRAGATITLDESARLALGLGDDQAALDWDAYRREDGRWIVTATEGGRRASWIYDTVGSSVQPLDDLARAWMGMTPVSDPIEDALGLIADTPVVRPDAEVEEISSDREVERPRLVAVPAFEDDTPDEAPDDIVQDEPAPLPEQPVLPLPSTQTVVIETPAAEPEPARPAKAKPKARRGRASVPSWDEILFGSKPDEQA